MRYPMRGVRKEDAMILVFERLGFDIWSYGTSDWGWDSIYGRFYGMSKPKRDILA